MRSQQSPCCCGAGCLWREHNQRQYQMLPPRVNCLLLHQFNELFFRGHLASLPEGGGKGGLPRRQENAALQHILSPNIPIVIACWYGPLFCMIDPHCYMFSSKHLHAKSPPMFLTFTLNYAAESTQGFSLVFMVSAKLFPPPRRPHYSTQEEQALTRVEWFLPPFPALAQRISVSLGEVGPYFY